MKILIACWVEKTLLTVFYISSKPYIHGFPVKAIPY